MWGPETNYECSDTFIFARPSLPLRLLRGELPKRPTQRSESINAWQAYKDDACPWEKYKVV
jgi:hypothetical protein